MKLLKCLYIFCFFHFTLQAQQNFDHGYIISPNKDSVKGFIKVSVEADLSNSVSFKKDMDGELKTFTPAELPGFGTDLDNYKSLQFLNTADGSVKVTAFVKQLVSGVFNLYAYVNTHGRFYLLQKDTTLYFLNDVIYQGNGEIVQDGNYQNYLNFAAVSCEKLKGQAEHIGYDDKDMAAFVLKVNQCISGSNAVSYYHKAKTQMVPVVFVGALPLSGEASQFTANFTLRFTLPRIDKKTSLNVGVNYSSTNKETAKRDFLGGDYTIFEKNQIISIPVTFQYNFTTKRIQPYIYAGFSGAYVNTTTNSQRYDAVPSYKHTELAMVFGLGIEARIISRLFLKADWRYELVLQFPAIGISYQF